MSQIHLETVVGPRTELEDAGLFVEWKVLDVDLAAGFVDGRRFPFDQSAVIHGGFGRQRHFEIAVGATFNQSFIEFQIDCRPSLLSQQKYLL